jgi:hypothetical protein
MSEKKKTFPLRLPEPLHEWLKANVKGTINDFIVEAITERMRAFKPEPEAELKELNFEIPERFATLLDKRAMYGRDTNKDFLEVENYILNHYYYSYDFNELINKHSQAQVALPYLTELEKLEDWDDREYIRGILKDADLKKRCGGDPNRIIFGELTAKDIIDAFAFSIGKTYSVTEVAAKLGLSYQQAYQHAVPFLVARGIKVERKTVTSNLHRDVRHQ